MYLDRKTCALSVCALLERCQAVCRTCGWRVDPDRLEGGQIVSCSGKAAIVTLKTQAPFFKFLPHLCRLIESSL